MDQHIHLIGIGGTGMGPLAKIFLEMGFKVSGSDLSPSETTDYLTELGAQIDIGHSPSNVVGATKVVYSTAVPFDNVELVEAQKQGIPVLHRSEVWADFLNNGKGIAVAGAHGKTTISSMISLLLEQAGFDPTVLIGARFAPFGPGAKHGRGGYVVGEADESDRSFLRYHPTIAVVTSIEADHLENYQGKFENLVSTYRQFLANCKKDGVAILGVDDKVVKEIVHEVENKITYALHDRNADWWAENITQSKGNCFFDAVYQGETFGNFELQIPGDYNISNALATIAVGKYLGIELEQIQSSLANFSGAQRRFQKICLKNDILVIDDYAHHPTEIQATLKAAKDGWNRRIIAVFQPHRYSRTSYLMEEFASSFTNCDLALITDVYSPPPEKPIAGVSAEVLVEKVKQKGVVASYIKEADLVEHLLKIVEPNDMVITMGAGSIFKTAHEFCRRLAIGS